MNTIPKVLAICGSTRQHSTNLRLIKAIALLAEHLFEIEIYTDIAILPHFNPDLLEEDTPETVFSFRRKIAAAAGVLICTPEYAHGVPGSLKNAIDWTVSSADFDGKPTMLITASTDGKEGHHSLKETLKVIQAKGIDEFQMLIPFAQTKVNAVHEIIDNENLASIKRLILSYKGTL